MTKRMLVDVAVGAVLGVVAMGVVLLMGASGVSAKIYPPVIAASQDRDFLVELTEEGIENGRLGLQGRLTSDVRAELVEDPGWEQIEAWVLREVEWDVGPVDHERSVAEGFALVPVVARGAGRLSDTTEALGVVVHYVVLYGMAGEFPGLLGVRSDGEPLVIYDILENKYDWRIAVPD